MNTKYRLIDLPRVCEITCQGKTSIYQLIAVGELHPIKLGRKTVFAESEVFDWVAQRLESRSRNPTASAPATVRRADPKVFKKTPNKASLQAASPSRGKSHE